MNNIFFPKEKKSEFNTYHTFVIQVDRRDELKKFLEKKEGFCNSLPDTHSLTRLLKNLGYKKKLPITENQSKRIISLPINQYLKEKENYISNLINKFITNFRILNNGKFYK